MFVGSYWFAREESLEVLTEKLARFLESLVSYAPTFAEWFEKGSSRRAAMQACVSIDPAGIVGAIRRNRRDSDGEPIAELGYRFSVWNGADASISATLGATSSHVMNSVVVDVDDETGLGLEVYGAVLRELIRVFDPEYAVVSSDSFLEQLDCGDVWEAGWLTYARGGHVIEHSAP